MKFKESHYIGFDGVKMHMSVWHPDDEKPRALLIAIHGLGSHGYTLKSIGEYFSERGYAVFAPDMRGFGHYSGLKGHVMSFDEYIEDMYNIVMQVKDQYLNKLTFLFGHSLGGQHVIRYVATYPEAVDGMILSCPAVSVQMSTLYYVFGWILSILNVKRYITLDRGKPTHDPEALKEMEEDPLGFDSITPRFGIEGVKGAKRAMTSAREIMLPALVQQAGDDKNVDPEKTKEFFEKLASPDKTWRLYEGLYHGLHQEIQKEMVFRDMELWLDKRLPA